MLTSNFNPQGSREPRQGSTIPPNLRIIIFQSTRLSRASTYQGKVRQQKVTISIHKALASLDVVIPVVVILTPVFQSTRLSRASTCNRVVIKEHHKYFNPQGSREPRRVIWVHGINLKRFQSTRLSRASTNVPHYLLRVI